MSITVKHTKQVFLCNNFDGIQKLKSELGKISLISIQLEVYMSHGTFCTGFSIFLWFSNIGTVSARLSQGKHESFKLICIVIFLNILKCITDPNFFV